MWLRPSGGYEDDPSAKRKHRRRFAPGSPLAGALLLMAFIGVIAAVIFFLRWTGVVNRHVLPRVASDAFHADAEVLKAVASTDAAWRSEDGTPLEYVGHRCSVSLDKASLSEVSHAYSGGLDSAGALSWEQVWEEQVDKKAGSAQNPAALREWSQVVDRSVRDAVQAIQDSGQLKGAAAAAQVFFVGCGLGATLVSASQAFPKAAQLACSEPTLERALATEAFLQQSLSGSDLLRSRAVVVPGVSMRGRLAGSLDAVFILAQTNTLEVSCQCLAISCRSECLAAGSGPGVPCP
jgi:hypothetical protein